MTPALGTYAFTVDGALGDHWASWLGDLTLTRHDDGTTTVSGSMADQAALHGVLGRLRDIGVTLLAVQADTAHRS
jgi:hypothetical protein